MLPKVFADWPIGPSLNSENPMGDQKNPDQQNPGYTDQEKKRASERAGQKPRRDYERDQASNPERRERQDPQLDPNHIQEDPAPQTKPQSGVFYKTPPGQRAG